MKNILKLVLFSLAICCCSFAFAQDNYASTLKMGAFKLGQNLEQVEEILSKNISESEAKLYSENYEKWYRVTHEGISYAMGFEIIYNENASQDENDNAPKRYKLSRIKCKDDAIKTKSGINIGMNKMQAFKILDQLNIDYNYSKYSELDDNGKKNGIVHESITITDEGRVLELEMKAGEIINFILQYGGDGC